VELLFALGIRLLLYTQEEVRQMMSLTWGGSLLLICCKISNSGKYKWEANLSTKLKKDFVLTPIVLSAK
jgi:hypothetical protein